MSKISLFNSLVKYRSLQDFTPFDDNTVRMYSCGPTVYNYAHIGNMRAFLFADLLQRVLRVVGKYNVKWVMNITNIDDKTIRDSAVGSAEWLPEMGTQTNDGKQNLLLFTDYFEKSFLEDISKLGIKPEHFFAMPKATEYISQMQDLIRSIVDKGIGYISDGSVYFSVSEWRKTDEYGKLYNIDFNNFRSGVRIDADEYEREDVSDFVLWKAKKPNEPHWDFEINGQQCPGRPGWHIECSAMEKELLGLPFDIHTGGVDLKFPHHEDEIAQSKAGYGIEPTAFWCHNEFLEVEGEKMSKSKGNFFTLRELLNKGIDPLDIRFAMFSVHYRSVYNFTFDGLKAASKARIRIQDYIYELFSTGNNKSVNGETIINFKDKIFNHLANDLHTPYALSEIFTFINSYPAKSLDDKAREEAIKLFRDLNDIFDVWIIGKKIEEKIEIPQEIIALAEQRLRVKSVKDFAEADKLRQIILDSGYILKDTKDSYVIEKKD
ncbi:MAG: cysteine--tRNA ligase [FCB group bacterium]